jgi:hypothetical protein
VNLSNRAGQELLPGRVIHVTGPDEKVSPVTTVPSRSLAARKGRLFPTRQGLSFAKFTDHLKSQSQEFHPTEIASIHRNWRKDGPWTMDELEKLLPGTLWAGATQGPFIPDKKSGAGD